MPPKRHRSNLSADAKEEIAEVFDLFDADKSGCLDKHEMKVGMRAMGFQVTKRDIENIFKAKDIDNLGYLKFDQFREVVSEWNDKRSPEDEYKQVFALFDKENTGRITVKDIERVCKEVNSPLRHDEIKDIIRQFTQEDYITQAQFIKMMDGTR